MQEFLKISVVLNDDERVLGAVFEVLKQFGAYGVWELPDDFKQHKKHKNLRASLGEFWAGFKQISPVTFGAAVERYSPRIIKEDDNISGVPKFGGDAIHDPAGL